MKEKIQAVDLCRTFAIFLVMTAHLRNCLYEPMVFEFHKFFYRVQINGGYGVCVFFVISGFLITKILAEGPGGLFKPSLRHFYVRRIGRIFPLLTLTLLLGLLITHTGPRITYIKQFCFYTPRARYDPPFWASILTFSFNWLEISRFPYFCNFGAHWNVLWSLAVEEQFYLFYPLMLWMLGGHRRLISFLLFIVLSGPLWRWWAWHHWSADIPLGLHASFAEFDQIALGCLLYLSTKGLPGLLEKRPVVSLLVCGAGLTMVLGVVFFTDAIYGKGRILGLTVLGLGVFLFLSGAFHLRFFESKLLWLLSLPGKYSYGNYLLHITVLYFFYQYFQYYLQHFKLPVVVLAFFAISTALCAVSFHFFEVPSNKFIRAKLDPPPPPQPT